MDDLLTLFFNTLLTSRDPYITNEYMDQSHKSCKVGVLSMVSKKTKVSHNILHSCSEKISNIYIAEWPFYSTHCIQNGDVCSPLIAVPHDVGQFSILRWWVVVHRIRPIYLILSSSQVKSLPSFLISNINLPNE